MKELENTLYERYFRADSREMNTNKRCKYYFCQPIEFLAYNVPAFSWKNQDWPKVTGYVGKSHDATLVTNVDIILQGNVKYNSHTLVTLDIATRLTSPLTLLFPEQTKKT